VHSQNKLRCQKAEKGVPVREIPQPKTLLCCIYDVPCTSSTSGKMPPSQFIISLQLQIMGMNSLKMTHWHLEWWHSSNSTRTTASCSLWMPWGVRQRKLSMYQLKSTVYKCMWLWNCFIWRRNVLEYPDKGSLRQSWQWQWWLIMIIYIRKGLIISIYDITPRRVYSYFTNSMLELKVTVYVVKIQLVYGILLWWWLYTCLMDNHCLKYFE
jgi:hypothetical protein